MMATTLVGVEQYLNTSYRPDCDYVDGIVVERNLGQYGHSTSQTRLVEILLQHAKTWRVRVKVELRLKIRDGKFRVPDVMVLPVDAPRTPVIETAPLLCIEVLSRDDRLNEIAQRAAEYVSIGVPQTWIVDPEGKKVYVYTDAGLNEWKPPAPNALMQCGPIVLELSELFAEEE